MSLIVREAGLCSLLVDFGRPRSRSLGVPLGGAADRGAMTLGNALVGNPPETPALEVTLLGPTLEADSPTACVLFGADFRLMVKGSSASPGTTFTLEPGEVLRIGAATRNARAYFCVAGGFRGQPIAGSCSGLLPLKAGDQLACPSTRVLSRALPFVTSDDERPDRQAPQVLRVLPGPQRDWFADDLYASEFELSPASNRMGLRFKGKPLTRLPGELVSEAVSPGAMQVTNDGQLIILGVDGQTIGGYPKVAHVIRADLDRLAQLRPGSKVCFKSVCHQQAEAAAEGRRSFLAAWQRRLEASDRAPQFLEPKGRK